MSTVAFGAFMVHAGIQTGRTLDDAGMVVTLNRLPTDPLFYSDVTLENIIVGSRYWLVPNADESNVLASGTAAATTVELTGIPVYANPQLLQLRVRKASSGTKYLPLRTYAYQGRDGAFFYVSQIVDSIVA